ncbi:MAG: NAD(P)-dependent oxidoreductase [Prevotellaceae bacterium]|nr:NAD(P)-dependent oxidoreductase [Prevotellaceae bacterium]
MNYIITGGTGFIGTHLANLLREHDREARIWNLDIVDPARLDAGGMTGKELEEYTTIRQWKSPVADGQTRQSAYIYCDVRKPIYDLPLESTADDVIFNLAAVHRTPGHPDYAYFETNMRGAENVCAFAERHGIRRIVFTSSIAPYGAAEELKEETTLPTPNTPYGISKLVAEKTHMAWQARAAGRQLTIVRPGVVFGKGENGNFTRLYWGIRGGKFVYPGRKDTIKACIYVKELVRFMLWCIESQMSGVEIYNCTFEPAYSIERIVETMKRVTGMKRFVPLIPSWALMPAAAVIGCLGAPMGICPARVRKLMVSTNISGRKLASSGYKFRYTLEEAIADWYGDNGGKWLK